MRQVTLPKKTAWVVFTLLLLTDAFLDVARRVEGNSLWQPIVTVIGINYVPLLVPLILPLFYVVVKVLGWLVRKVDRLPQAEELILTTLVIVYFVYDLWVVAVDFFGFRLISNFRQTIPLLLATSLGYALWAESVLRRQN